MIASIVLSMIFEWKLGLTALSFVPLLLIATYFQAKIIMGQSALERDALQKSAKVAMEAISNIRTVAGLGKEQTFHDIYMDSLRGPHQAALRKSWVRGFIFGFANSLPMFAYATTMYYGGKRILQNIKIRLLLNVFCDFLRLVGRKRRTRLYQRF